MPSLNAPRLVEIVCNLATPHQPVVTSEQVISHCNAQQPPIEYAGGAGWQYGEFEEADTEEARGHHRLHKFKTSRDRRGAPNAWCRHQDLEAARPWASQHGWLLVPWNATRRRWEWESADDPLTTPVVV